MMRPLFIKPTSPRNGYVLLISIILLLVLSVYTGSILTTEHLRSADALRHLHKLQAAVLSYSGLSCAQAFVAGYGSHDVTWETGLFQRTFRNGGGLVLAAHHEAGWLKVRSTGCFMNDTTVYEGMLGLAPPAEVASNALSLVHSSDEVVVADCAMLKGNVATNGGNVVTRNSGIFNGATVPLKAIGYTGEIIEKTLSVFDRFPDSRKETDSIVRARPEDLGRMLSVPGCDMDKPLFAQGRVSLKNVAFSYVRAPLYVQGKLDIGQSSKLAGLKCYVKGTVSITDSVDMEQCTIVSTGNVTIEGNARFGGMVICAETLTVGGASRVTYPSLLYRSSNYKDKECKRVIIIKDYAKVQGTVATGIFNDNTSHPRIVTGIRSHIEGLVICPDALMPYGILRGSVYAGRIIYIRDRNVNVNLLKEVSIIHRDLSLMTVPLFLSKNGISRYVRIVRLSGDAL